MSRGAEIACAFLAAGATLGFARQPAEKKPVEEWAAPADERSRPNPVAGTPDGLKKGRALYQRNCALCHGDKGKGDGPSARMHAQRTTQPPHDLSDPALQARMTDGEIFWKIGTGLRRDGQILMPAFEQEIGSPEDRWKVVLFVRSLAEPKP